MKFLGFIFLLVYFQLEASAIDGAQVNFNFSFGNKQAQFDGITLSVIANEPTEAVYSFDINRSEFCCEREQTYEPFTDMSEMESNLIVENLLGPRNPYTSPAVTTPSKGQR